MNTLESCITSNTKVLQIKMERLELSQQRKRKNVTEDGTTLDGLYWTRPKASERIKKPKCVSIIYYWHISVNNFSKSLIVRMERCDIKRKRQQLKNTNTKQYGHTMKLRKRKWNPYQVNIFWVFVNVLFLVWLVFKYF